MKKIHFIFIGFLATLYFLMSYDLSNREEAIKLAGNQQTSQSTTGQAPKNIEFSFSQNNNPQITEQFVANFRKESSEISKVQNDPVKVQQRMQKLAETMTQHEVRAIYELISDDKNNADQRALAVELLSIKNDTASLTALQNFVANSKNINGNEWDRKKELETVLRAQAVEGIAGYANREIALSTLSFLQHKVDEKFLSDRISRASSNLFNRTQSLEQQDDEALKKLVE